jgi:hypothetical protein
MGRERGEILLNALLIPDICINLRKNTKLRTVKRRNVKPGLTHQGEQSHRLEGNRFTAGVGTCHNQKVKVLSKADVDGNHLFPVQQRVASFPDIDGMFHVKKRS